MFSVSSTVIRKKVKRHRSENHKMLKYRRNRLKRKQKQKPKQRTFVLVTFLLWKNTKIKKATYQRKHLIWGAQSPRGLESLTSIEGSTAAGMHASEAVTESLQESQATSRRQRYNTNWEWGEVLKPQRQPLVTQLTLLKQFHSWGPRIKIYKPNGAILIQIAITVKRKVTDMVNFNNKIISKDGQRGFNKHHDPTFL